MTLTVPTSSSFSWSGNPVTITALVVDQYQNWVADGTSVAFFSDWGIFQGGTSAPMKVGPRTMTNKTTTNGTASIALKAPEGTANVVVLSNGKAVTLTIQFVNPKLYLPLILR